MKRHEARFTRSERETAASMLWGFVGMLFTKACIGNAHGMSLASKEAVSCAEAGGVIVTVIFLTAFARAMKK